MGNKIITSNRFCDDICCRLIIVTNITTLIRLNKISYITCKRSNFNLHRIFNTKNSLEKILNISIEIKNKIVEAFKNTDDLNENSEKWYIVSVTNVCVLYTK